MSFSHLSPCLWHGEFTRPKTGVDAALKPLALGRGITVRSQAVKCTQYLGLRYGPCKKQSINEVDDRVTTVYPSRATFHNATPPPYILQ